MPTKIPFNGFGRLGKMQILAMMSHLMANIPQKGNRLFQEAAESLQEAIGDADSRKVSLRKYPTECVREFKMIPPESVVTDVVVDTSDIPNPRYHDRTFPKDYDKKKESKRRQQKQARRKNK